jgi:hypothetical protein
VVAVNTSRGLSMKMEIQEVREERMDAQRSTVVAVESTAGHRWRPEFSDYKWCDLLPATQNQVIFQRKEAPPLLQYPPVILRVETNCNS